MEIFWLIRVKVLYIYINICSGVSFGLGEVIDIIFFIYDFYILVYMFNLFFYEMLFKGLYVYVCICFIIRLINSL